MSSLAPFQKMVTFNPVVSVTTVDQEQDPLAYPASSKNTTVSPQASLVSLTLPTSSSVPAHDTTEEAGRKVINANDDKAVSSMTCWQLQDSLNKQMLDLQEEERAFLEQAGRVNSWDQTLLCSGDKITEIDSTINKIRSDQKRIGNAVNFFKMQNAELDNGLCALERNELGKSPNVESDPGRTHLCELATSTDKKLKKIATDLKLVIEGINDWNGLRDYPKDPTFKVLKILNEHTNALQHIEETCKDLDNTLKKFQPEPANVNRNYIFRGRNSKS